MAIKIGLDPGHSKKSKGTYSIDTEIDGLYESDYTLELCRMIDGHLRENGFETFLTRDTDADPGNVSKRAEACAKAGCDFALSVHFNGFGSESANGTEVFVPYGEKAANIEVGFREVLTKFFKERKPYARSNSYYDRNDIFDKKMNVSTKKFDAVSSQKEYFGFIRTAWENGLSADLIEICFLTNRKDFDTYINHKEEIAEGIAKAIVEGFGKTFNKKRNYPKVKPVGGNKVDVKL